MSFKSNITINHCRSITFHSPRTFYGRRKLFELLKITVFFKFNAYGGASRWAMNGRLSRVGACLPP